jgi:hypothetical protein
MTTADQPRDPPSLSEGGEAPEDVVQKHAAEIYARVRSGGLDPRFAAERLGLPFDQDIIMGIIGAAARAEGPRPSGGGELTPCPCCGGNSVEAVQKPDPAYWEAGCWKCALAIERMTREDAIAAWNRRPSIPAEGGEGVELVKELRDEADQLVFLGVHGIGGLSDAEAALREAASFIEQRLSRLDREAVARIVSRAIDSAFGKQNVLLHTFMHEGFAWPMTSSLDAIRDEVTQAILSLVGSGGEGLGSLPPSASAPVAPRAGGGAP